MLRTLRIGVTVFAVAAGCLLVAMWVRSYRTADIVRRPVSTSRSILVASEMGRVVVLSTTYRDQRNWTTRSVRRESGLFSSISLRKYETFLGFGLIRDPVVYDPWATSVQPEAITIAALRHSYVMYRRLNGTGLIIPYWFLVLLAGMAVAVMRLRWPLRFSMRGVFLVMTFASLLLGLVAWLDLGSLH